MSTSYSGVNYTTSNRPTLDAVENEIYINIVENVLNIVKNKPAHDVWEEELDRAITEFGNTQDNEEEFKVIVRNLIQLFKIEIPGVGSIDLNSIISGKLNGIVSSINKFYTLFKKLYENFKLFKENPQLKNDNIYAILKEIQFLATISFFYKNNSKDSSEVNPYLTTSDKVYDDIFSSTDVLLTETYIQIIESFIRNTVEKVDNKSQYDSEIAKIGPLVENFIGNNKLNDMIETTLKSEPPNASIVQHLIIDIRHLLKQLYVKNDEGIAPIDLTLMYNIYLMVLAKLTTIRYVTQIKTKYFDTEVDFKSYGGTHKTSNRTRKKFRGL